MPENIQCPSCERKLRVPDNLIGKKVKCPSCGIAFTATEGLESLPATLAAPAEISRPVPESDYAEEESAEDRQGNRRWKKVSTGLLLVLIALCLMVITFIAAAIGGGVVGVTNMPIRQPGAGGGAVVVTQAKMGAGFRALTLIGGVLEITWAVLALIGFAFCLQAPARHGAKKLAATTVILACVTLLFTIGTLIARYANPEAAVRAGPDAVQSTTGILSMVEGLLGSAKYFVFILFLMAVARCLRAASLRTSTKYLAILTGVAIFFAITWLVLMATVAKGPWAEFQKASQAGGAGALPKFDGAAMASLIPTIGCMCVDFVLALACFVWLLVVLAQARSLIKSHLARA